MWMLYYSLIITIPIPALIYLAINIIILIYVQISSRRVQPISEVPSTNQRNEQQLKLSRRDIHLLRHIVIMFLVYVVGWFPIGIIAILSSRMSVSAFLSKLGSLLAEVSLLCDIADLFLYSHDLRKYLHRKFLPCFYRWDHKFLQNSVNICNAFFYTKKSQSWEIQQPYVYKIRSYSKNKLLSCVILSSYKINVFCCQSI